MQCHKTISDQKDVRRAVAYFRKDGPHHAAVHTRKCTNRKCSCFPLKICSLSAAQRDRQLSKALLSALTSGNYCIRCARLQDDAQEQWWTVTEEHFVAAKEVQRYDGLFAGMDWSGILDAALPVVAGPRRYARSATNGAAAGAGKPAKWSVLLFCTPICMTSSASGLRPLRPSQYKCLCVLDAQVSMYVHLLPSPICCRWQQDGRSWLSVACREQCGSSAGQWQWGRRPACAQ